MVAERAKASPQRSAKRPVAKDNARANTARNVIAAEVNPVNHAV
jgi:hypothetical protein